MGVRYGFFLIKSPDVFTWEEGKEFAEPQLDDSIYRHNLLVKARAKRLHKRLDGWYQLSRAGPITKCLRGPCMEPTLMNESWYCSYRYKGAPETNPELMTYGGIDISTNSTKKPNVEFGEEIDDLY